MLDTDICVELLRGRAPGVLRRMRRYEIEAIAISSITLAELWHGAAKSSRPDMHRGLLMDFCMPLAVADFDSAAAVAYGQVRFDLERRGLPIGPMDTLIASHALALDVPLITMNLREFSRVEGLCVENWVAK